MLEKLRSRSYACGKIFVNGAGILGAYPHLRKTDLTEADFTRGLVRCQGSFFHQVTGLPVSTLMPDRKMPQRSTAQCNCCRLQMQWEYWAR